MHVKDEQLIERARVFATAAHAAVRQVRKYTGDPYIVHPWHVASLVSVFGGSPAMVAAAFLHDVVEDTGVEIGVIRAEFGDAVADLVASLTDVSRPEDGNRAVRKALDRKHIKAASAEAQTIKCCDLISNADSIVAHDVTFARVYLREMTATLDVLARAWPEPKRAAREAVRKGCKIIAEADAHAEQAHRDKLAQLLVVKE
jgi:guanosine-3',5'-bis(diphosphate) 3'-pyrophosphohydrolase